MSNRWSLAIVVACLVGAGLVAGAARAQDQALCEAAGVRAEQRAGLPSGLLRAIGVVESGRRDPLSGMVAPWPWTIDAAGKGEVFEAAAQALARTRALLDSHVGSIDIGCFQINLAAHPEAFQSLEAGFDPDVNAAAAARLLRRLHDSTGSWEAAVARYHSATPRLGAAYRDRVASVWGQDLRAPAWGVVELHWQPAASGVQVWTPGSAGGARVIHLGKGLATPSVQIAGGQWLAAVQLPNSQ